MTADWWRLRPRSVLVGLLALALPSVVAIVMWPGNSRLAHATKPDADIRLQGSAAFRQAERAGIDVRGVIETVSHRFEPANGKPGRLVSEDRSYRVELAGSGFSLALRRKSV